MSADGGGTEDAGGAQPSDSDGDKEKPKIDLPPEVQSLFARYPRLNLLFHGKAKGGGADGQPLESPQSYERELLIKLAIKGVTSPDTLAAVLKARPNGHAASQDDEFLAAFIANILNIACPQSSASAPKGPPALPFTVDKVTRFNADPPMYTMTINGVEIELTSVQLFKLVEFKQRCFDRLHEVPPLPFGRGAQTIWEMMVPQITAKAVDITPLADGTRRGALEIAIKKSIEDLPRGDSVVELRDGRGMITKYRRRDVLLFTTDAIVRALVMHDSEPTREQIAQLLPKLGCERHELKVPGGKRGQRIECWRATLTAPTSTFVGAGAPAAAAPSFQQPTPPPNPATSPPTDTPQTTTEPFPSSTTNERPNPEQCDKASDEEMY